MRKESKGYLIWLATWTCCLFCFSALHSQCTVAGPIPIPDNDVLTIELSVFGLVDNNLASPTQGICGIEIDFMHDYLGDLTVSLVSPSGTVVQLIGPPTTAIGSTDLANWDIDFVPCGVPAVPDAGYTDIWSNNQNWLTIFPYTGTYHPNTGCLENFNVGPANGIWQVIFQDHDLLALGVIDSITLIFCNPVGLVCDCEPNAGLLSPSSFNICSGENIQSGDITIDYGGNIPSPALYSYEYLLVSGNTILQNGASFSISPPAGSYTLCGLSYLIADTTIINALVNDGDYSLLALAIESGIICAQLTTDCIELEVSDQPDSIFISGDLCNGEVFSYGGQDYTTDGVYYQIHDGPGLCDTVFELRIAARTLTVSVEPPDTLTCGSGAVVMQAMATGATGPFTYQWSTINGNITSPANGQSILGDQPGQYFVDVSDGVCEGTGSVHVFAHQGFPQVFFEGGTLTCDILSVTIEPIFIPSAGNILWTGPSGFSSTQPNITVTIPGTYQLMVTNDEGCTTSRSVDIIGDTTTYPIDIYILGKSCLDSSITLADLHPERLILWNWTGPNSFSSTYWRPVVSDPGLYTLTGTFRNGCTRSGTYFFDGDFALPDLAVSPPDTLNCNEIITLTMSSSTPGVSYTWTGPNSFQSQQPSIMISQEGNYSGTVVAPNGCVSSDVVAIVLGDDVFDYEVFTDTLTCSQTLVTIGVTAPEADFFDWLNFSGPGDGGPMIDVGVGGIYRVLMRDTDTNCEVLAEVEVYSNLAVPYFEYTTDTISCLHPIAELNFVPVAGYTYTSMYWELPDLSIVPGPTLMSGLAGEHRLFATGLNGCAGVRYIYIPFDTLQPFVILETDTLQCADTIQIISQSLDSITAYQWNGPGIISIADDLISVNVAGWYHLSAFGINGCPAEHDILVDSNYILPLYTLMFDSLRCDVPADLVVIPSDPILSYGWYDSGGLLLSSDSLLMVNQPGSYRLELQGINRCTAYDTIIIAPLQYPVIQINSDTITCAISSATLTVDIDIPQYTIVWVNATNDTISMTESILVNDAGPYIASVSGLNACESRDTVNVPFDTISPIALIGVTGQVKCKNREAVLDGLASTPDPLLYSWSTTGGSILSDPSLVQVDVRDTGFYYLTIERPDNGCVDTAMLYLSEDPDAIVLAYVDIVGPECTADDNASITVAGLEGGVGPFQYQLDGSLFQSSPVFDELVAGTFLLTIADAENCVFDTTVIIEPTLDFTVDAGPDLEIYLGENAQLSGSTNLPESQFLTDAWVTNSGGLCTDCADFEVGPLESTTYLYQVTSSTGCIREDELIVFVLEKGKYFLPNIFSPNGDGINDEIRINPSAGIERVLQWIVFDRWGNAAYGKTDFDPADSGAFWNGQASTGEYVNPGVFAYILEIQLINGKREVHHGDITVIRVSVIPWFCIYKKETLKGVVIAPLTMIYFPIFKLARVNDL